MMDTVLNLGLNDEVVEGLAAKAGRDRLKPVVEPRVVCRAWFQRLRLNCDSSTALLSEVLYLISTCATTPRRAASSRSTRTAACWTCTATWSWRGAAY